MKSRVRLTLLIFILSLGTFLRFYKVGSNPPNLYVDEVAIGYNAYSILKTGRDEYGKKFPLSFRSFEDYKLPLHIYLISLSMAVFGKNEFSVRFPSALSGTLTILVFYLFLRTLTREDRGISENFPLVAGFLLAISPWHLQFSRTGHEATLGLLLFLAGSCLFFSFVKKKKYYFLLSSLVLFVLTFYTYHSYRIVTPLWLVFMSSIYFKRLKKNCSPIISGRNLFCLLFFLVLIFPFLFYIFSSEGSARIGQVSIFTVGSGLRGILTFPISFWKNYLSHFSLEYLFFSKSQNFLFHVPGFGLIFKFLLPFFLAGLYFLMAKQKGTLKTLLIGSLLISIIPAALSLPCPHPARSLLMVIPCAAITAMGFHFLWNKFYGLKRTIFTGLVLIFAIYEMSFYFHNYWIHFPFDSVGWWGGISKPLVQGVSEYKDKYPLIAVNKGDFYQIYIYFLFYAPDIPVVYADTAWKKPPELGNRRIIFVSNGEPFYLKEKNIKLLKGIRWNTPGREVGAQVWEL